MRTDKDRFVAFAFCWADLLFEVDPRFDIVFAAGPTEVLLGPAPQKLVGRSIYDFVVPGDIPLFGQMLKDALRIGRVDNEGVRLKNPSGGMFAMSVTGYCIDGAGSNFFLGMRRRAWPVASENASGKTPGDLYDAGAFSQLASERIKRLKAAGGQPELTLVALPGLGKLCGTLPEDDQSKLHQQVKDALKAGSVAGDSVAEIANDRYSILHESDRDLTHLLGHIQSITKAADPQGAGVKAQTASVTMDENADTLDQEDLAQGLLYMMNRFRDSQGTDFNIKSLSTNIAVICQSAAKEVTEFKGIVSGTHFNVALQPIIDIHSGEIHHFEALCRFHNAPMDDSPYRTITFAEETGLIHQFDLAMAKKVIDVLAKTGRSQGPRVNIAVNVSGHSVSVPAYVDALHRLLRDSPWTKGRLMFEITESSRMTDLDVANNFIQTLRKMGYEISLDDFGAGAASFQYLSSLEVDVVKLDGSAIRNAESAQKGRAFLSALTELCRRLNVKTIAEMIDTPQRFAFCRDCGCDYVQGFLFGKPSIDLKSFGTLPHSDLFRAKTWGGGSTLGMGTR
jgi:EAL domain-containing protein (putative c-di-GMP-specific phosphodiesterase class I)